MFQINSYLQYRNTPDGKPRVLVEGVDYNLAGLNKLVFAGKFFKVPIRERQEVLFDDIANLSDCRPLLTVDIDGQEWTEGDIAAYHQELFTDTGGSFQPQRFEVRFGIVVFDGYQMNFSLDNKLFHLSNAKTNLGSFFDDPAKYSKLLWNCSEEEGWQKVFKLLEIES